MINSYSLQLYATPELDVVEFACLTYQPVVEPFDVSFKLNLKDTGLFKDISELAMPSLSVHPRTPLHSS